MELSHSVLLRFVKDYSLPIQVLQEPYFSYFINLYDDLYQTKEKYNLLINTLKNFSNEDEFLKFYYDIRNRIIEDMKLTESFDKFNNDKLEQFNVHNNFRKSDVYNCENVGKQFLSIDLSKANFQALKYYDKSILFDNDSYENLIFKYTDLQYFKESKYLRQVIFGNMNPKKQIKIETYLINMIREYVSQYIPDENVKMLTADELVYGDYDFNNVNYSKLQEEIYNKYNLNVDVELFTLEQIKPYKYFVKNIINKNKKELKCVPTIYHAQVYKHFYNMPIEDNDLMFYYEHNLAKFSQPLSFE